MFLCYTSGALMTVGVIPYVIKTYKNKANPNLTSNILWCLMNITFTVTYLASGEKAESIYGVMSGILNTLIIISLLLIKHKRTFSPNRLEKVCIFLCAVILTVWAVFHFLHLHQTKEVMQIALFLSILADIPASIPQLIDSWKTPEKDHPLGWIIVTGAYGISIFTVTTNTIAGYSLPMYMFVACFLITLPLVTYQIKKLFTTI